MKLVIALLATAAAISAQEWSQPVQLLHEYKPYVTYRGKVQGSYLVIEATIEPGWHTFTMDNEKRASEKLAGKPSLGVDQPTRFELADSLQTEGAWLQSEPADFSKPKLRWYSWGYEGKALFASKVKLPSTSGKLPVGIRGQACTSTTCKNIDATLEVPFTAAQSAAPSEIKSLIPVR